MSLKAQLPPPSSSAIGVDPAVAPAVDLAEQIQGNLTLDAVDGLR